MKRSKIKRGRDVTKVLHRNDCETRRGKGSHMVGTLPNGDKIVYYDGELSKGVRHKIVKALAAAGFLAGSLLFGMTLAAGGVGNLIQILALAF